MTVDSLIDEYLSAKKQEGESKSRQKVLIGFAAIPGSGKTTLAKELEIKLNALRISGDEIREIVKDKMNGVIPSSELILNKLVVFLTNYSGIVILDSSLDRKIKSVKELTDKLNYKLFVISIESNPEISLKQILQRDGLEKGSLITKHIDRFQSEHKEFLKEYTPDISLHHPFQIEQCAEIILEKATNQI